MGDAIARESEEDSDVSRWMQDKEGERYVSWMIRFELGVWYDQFKVAPPVT